MSTLHARFVVALISLLTFFFGRWRRHTILARVHSRLAPAVTVSVNGTPITFFTPDRTSVYWPRHGLGAEPDTLEWIDGFEAGDVLYDIGANVGAYSVYAAKRRAWRVIAVEPNPFSFHVLARNMALNGVQGAVTPLCLALGAQTEPGILALRGTESGSVGIPWRAARTRPAGLPPPPHPGLPPRRHDRRFGPAAAQPHQDRRRRHRT